MSTTELNAAEILGFDPFDPGFLRDPYARYRELRARGPLWRTSAGLWLATAHEPCTAVLRDPRFGHGDDPFGRGETATDAPGRSFLVADPPDHTRLRGLVSKAFTARMIERLRPRINAIVDQLLEESLDRGEVDLIDALAYPLPVIVISELLGVPPADEERFRGWSHALARGLDPVFLLTPRVLAEREQARMEFRAYFAALVDARRLDPGDDLVSALVAVEERGDPLSTAELLATCVLLLVAGHETTVNLIGNGTLALARHNAFGAVAEESAPAVVEELLRYDPPVQLTLRIALEDTDVCGQPVAKGEAVMALIGSANRDPAAFADPDRLELDRVPGRHLAFGLGIHFCLGAPLARLEGQIALTALARHAPTLLDHAPPYKDNLVLRGLASLPVRLSR